MRFLLGISLPVLIILFLFSTVHGMLISETGYRALSKAQLQRAQLLGELGELSDRRIWMEQRADLLQSSSLDPDMIDESVRYVLGYASPHDIVISRQEMRQTVARILEQRDNNFPTDSNDPYDSMEVIEQENLASNFDNLPGAGAMMTALQ